MGALFKCKDKDDSMFDIDDIAYIRKSDLRRLNKSYEHVWDVALRCGGRRWTPESKQAWNQGIDMTYMHFYIGDDDCARLQQVMKSMGRLISDD